MIIRKATLADIERLIQSRIDFLKIDRGYLSDDHEQLIRIQSQKYFEKHIPAEDFLSVVATIDKKIVSAAFLLIQERPPSPSFITGISATLVNVITLPQYRKMGIATKVIETIIEEAKQMNVSAIDLLATEEGKFLYKKLGFTEPSYTAMRLII